MVLANTPFFLFTMFLISDLCRFSLPRMHCAFKGKEQSQQAYIFNASSSPVVP